MISEILSVQIDSVKSKILSAEQRLSELVSKKEAGETLSELELNQLDNIPTVIGGMNIALQNLIKELNK